MKTIAVNEELLPKNREDTQWPSPESNQFIFTRTLSWCCTTPVFTVSLHLPGQRVVCWRLQQKDSRGSPAENQKGKQALGLTSWWINSWFQPLLALCSNTLVLLRSRLWLDLTLSHSDVELLLSFGSLFCAVYSGIQQRSCVQNMWVS